MEVFGLLHTMIVAEPQVQQLKTLVMVMQVERLFLMQKGPLHVTIIY